MSRFFSLRLFSLGFGAGYAWATYANVPLFRYYPLIGRFSLRDLADKTLGPAMSWYGWIAYGLIGGVALVLLGAVIPRRVIDRIPVVVYCLIPVVMMIAGWTREKSWFL